MGVHKKNIFGRGGVDSQRHTMIAICGIIGSVALDMGIKCKTDILKFKYIKYEKYLYNKNIFVIFGQFITTTMCLTNSKS